jgi:hypothetical protein
MRRNTTLKEDAVPGSVQFYDYDGPLGNVMLPDGQSGVMADIPAGATRLVVTSQRPPVPPKPAEPPPYADHELEVTVRVYGAGRSALEAAEAVSAAELPGGGEFEVISARPV